MADDVEAPSVPPEMSPGEGGSGKKLKRKDKVRGAWISFFGRILAQIIGAVASVFLAVLVLQKYQGKGEESVPSVAPDPVVSRVSSPRQAGEVALAVLPLDNFSADAAQDYFADRMTEALIADLAQIEGLRVISRTWAMQYKGRRKSLPQVGFRADARFAELERRAKP